MATRSLKRNVPKVGRPPAGDQGERVKDYPQLSCRLPRAARDTLSALAEEHGVPQWRMLVMVLDYYTAHKKRARRKTT